jgi:hypothetical protein
MMPRAPSNKGDTEMKLSRLFQISRLLTALLTVLALSGVATASAEAATEGPFWTVEGNKLEKNETREVAVKSFEGTTNPVRLEAELLGIKVKIECHLATFAKGGFIAGGSPGTTEAFSEFSDCTTTNLGSGCKVAEPIRTEKIRGELVVSDENGHFGRFILVEFDPATGTEGKFVELKFEGSSCLLKTTEVGKGLVVGSAFTDPTITGEETKAVETTNKTQAASYLVKFPDEFTDNGGVKSVWLLKTILGIHIFELIKITPFKALGNEAKLTGTVLYSLMGGEKYGQEV